MYFTKPPFFTFLKHLETYKSIAFVILGVMLGLSLVGVLLVASIVVPGIFNRFDFVFRFNFDWEKCLFYPLFFVRFKLGNQLRVADVIS